MSVEIIVGAIDNEIERLTQASEFLQRFQHESKNLIPKVKAKVPEKKKAFIMSASARKKIGAATRARWAALRKANKTEK